uniref:Amino acid transporter transmembrane domain-containing protein n=1 Tax=Stomoxys calcitrans TaxID=35570 RepID=A0A1I8P6F9_STOCA
MDYDPYRNRETKNLGYCGAFMNMVKCLFGTGILASPLAFRNVGWLMGFLASAAVVAIMTISVHILIRGMVEVSRRRQVPYMSFQKAMCEGLMEGPEWLHRNRVIAEYFVLFFMLGFYFGVGSVYVVFIADSVNKLLEHYWSIELDSRLIMCLEIIPLTMIFMIRRLKALVPFSALANVLLFSALIAIMGYIIVDGDMPALEEREAINDLAEMPLFVGTILFGCSSLGVFLAIESDMIKPKQFISKFGVLNAGMLINYLTMGLFAFLGYWKFGDALEGSITLNIPDDIILSQVITITYILAVFITYPLQCYVIVDILWINGAAAKYPSEQHLWRETVLRCFIVMTTVLVAICIPKFDLILSLVGCVTVTILSISFPAVLDICLRFTSDFGPYKIYLWRDLFLLIFGVACCISGMIGAILEIMGSGGD